jgi:quercetin dioxygenase-like cupin family protein
MAQMLTDRVQIAIVRSWGDVRFSVGAPPEAGAGVGNRVNISALHSLPRSKGRSMMDTKAATVEPFVRAPAAGSILNVLGVTHIYKAKGAETGGSFSLWEAVVPPGAGPPPHTHAREDEAFYVLSGELLFEFEGATAPQRVGPGGFFFGARQRRHAFSQRRGPARSHSHPECAELWSRSDVR